MKRSAWLVVLGLFVLGVAVGIGASRGGQAPAQAPRLAVRMTVTVPTGQAVHITEYDGGLAVVSLKDGPTLGLMPVVRDLTAKRVMVTVFDLAPDGRPGKTALEDVDLIVGSGARSLAAPSGMQVAVTGIVDRPAEAAGAKP